MSGIKSHNSMRHLLALMATFLAFGMCSLRNQAEAQAISVDYGDKKIWVGEPNQLTFIVTNATDIGEPVLPDVEGLEFEFSGMTNTSSRITIINGVRSESRTVEIPVLIRAEAPGVYHVPSIQLSVDGRMVESDSYRFQAVEAVNAGKLKADIIRNGKDVYVGEPIKLTLRIWVKAFHSDQYDYTVNENTTWRLMKRQDSNWGPFAESIQQLARSGRRPKGMLVQRPEGEYYLYEINREIRPTGLGAIEDLEDVEIAISYPTGLERSNSVSLFRRSDLEFSGLMPLRVRAEVNDIDVKPLPEEGRPEYFRGAVGDFIVRAGARPTDVAVGDPITLTFLVATEKDRTVLDTLRPPPLAEMTVLTDDFRIPRDPIAGEVEDNLKVFTQTLRPRSDDVTEIPPIPFSFFDPDLGEYKTVYTPAIPLSVSPAESLAAADIIRKGDDTTSLGSESDDLSAEITDEEETGLRANFPIGPAMLASSDRSIGATSYALLTLPPVCFAALALIVSRRRWRQAHPELVRSRTAFSRARRDLRGAEDPVEIGRIIRSYVCDRSSRPAASLTSAETLRVARQAGATPDILAGMDSILRAADRATHVPETTASAQRSDTANELVSALERCRWDQTGKAAR